MSNAIVIQASAEDVEILNDQVKTVKCSCGHEVAIAGNLIFGGDEIRTLASNAEITTCPNCGSAVQLPSRG